MDYIKNNKAAWEEAFEHRHEHWGEENHKRLLQEDLPFFDHNVAATLKSMDFNGKHIAQFCCNNGREILSLMQLGAASGTGFDIAENILEQARDTAQKAGIGHCKFVACNILELPDSYAQAFDFVFFTIGAITWFEDLVPLFQKASACLKPGGTFLLHDVHPFMNMLPLPGEDTFDRKNLQQLRYSYFRKEPWVENEGMGYMSGNYPSKTFTSFSHPMAAIIHALAAAGLRISRLDEYDYDIDLTDVYDGKGYPLSFLLLAQKEA